MMTDVMQLWHITFWPTIGWLCALGRGIHDGLQHTGVTTAGAEESQLNILFLQSQFAEDVSPKSKVKKKKNRGHKELQVDNALIHPHDQIQMVAWYK